MAQASQLTQLLDLKWVGPATIKDFHLLDITTITQLATANPDDLYCQLQTRTQAYHDPCVWDVFACAIAQAKGEPAKSWWHWTPIRKARMLAGTFVQPYQK